MRHHINNKTSSWCYRMIAVQALSFYVNKMIYLNNFLILWVFVTRLRCSCLIGIYVFFICECIHMLVYTFIFIMTLNVEKFMTKIQNVHLNSLFSYQLISLPFANVCMNYENVLLAEWIWPHDMNSLVYSLTVRTVNINWIK